MSFKSNITPNILSKVGLNLHNKKDHPICIIKNHIYKHFDSLSIPLNSDSSKAPAESDSSKAPAESDSNSNSPNFLKFDTLDPYVSISDNFDLLRIPKDHPARSTRDTYYRDETTVLRTHTSAHQNQLLAQGYTSFLVTGDVYRKDEIDYCHYPVFSQMECLQIIPDNVDPVEHLKKLISGLVEYLFPQCQYRFASDYFPFTEPSFEVEVEYNGKWLEILGCGIVHEEILNRYNIKSKIAAIGFGIDRLAMILFKIPDIRLFWTTDERILSQFKDGIISEYKPIPQLECITKDISFYVKNTDVKETDSLTEEFEWLAINDFTEIIRELFGDSVKNVNLFDKFYNKNLNKYSHTFRLTFEPNVHIKNPGEFTKEVNENMPKLGLLINNIIDTLR